MKSVKPSGEPKTARVRKQITSRSGPHHVDVHVGTRIGQLRLQSGLTQRNLAEQVGVSFQQLQKYENGKNRVSASKLYEISAALRVTIQELFDGLSEETEVPPAADLMLDKRTAYIGSPEGQRMIDSMLGIAPPLRQKVLSLIEMMASENGFTDS